MKSEAGTSTVSTTFGFAAFLVFVLLTTNISLGLWARSAATAIGYDETRRLAVAGNDCDAQRARSVERITARTRGWWRQVDADVQCSDDAVTVRLRARNARSALTESATSFDRTFIVRSERVR